MSARLIARHNIHHTQIAMIKLNDMASNICQAQQSCDMTSNICQAHSLP